MGKQPRVGDLVQLNQEQVEVRGYTGPAVGDVGVVFECVGIRCRVRWTHGKDTLPERDVLEILYANR